MDIQINNASGALSNCNSLYAHASELNTKVSELTNYINKIKTNWQSNGMDKESYILELEKQSRNLNIIYENVKKLSSAISNYVSNANQISNLTIGDSISGYTVSTGYTSASNAVNGVNSVGLNNKYVNDSSSIRGFAIVGEDGSIINRTYDSGISIEEFAKENGVSLDRVAVDVGKGDVGQAWVPASTFQ